MQQLMISDVTLREEQKRAESALSFSEKVEVAKALDRLEPYAIELAPIANEKVDSLLVKSIASVVKHSRLTLPAALSEEGVRTAWNALHEAEHPCIEIAVPVSVVQMEYVCHKKPDAVIELIGKLVAEAKSLCPEVEFAAEDATRSEHDFLIRAVKAASDAGAGVITLCDTAGLMLPDGFEKFFGGIADALPEGATLGIECPDALDLASACTLSAVKAGARLAKASVAGDGALPLDSFAELIRIHGAELGVECGIRMTELQRIKKQVDWVTHSKHTSASPFSHLVHTASDGDLKLDAESTLGEVSSAINRLGYDLSEEDAAKVFEAFRRIAAKKSVGEKELDAIIASEALQVPPTYKIESYVINSGNVITATAHIKLARQDATLQGIALGDGPIDAAFLAIEQIVGHHYELDDFQIQAVTEGREAMGSSLVRLRSNGRLYAGKGISTDVIGASIMAYISALNKIVYEETTRS